MRVKDVEIILRIPYQETDENGNKYSHVAFHDAILACEGTPIVFVGPDGVENIIGVVTSAEADGFPYMKVHGILWHGGTNEEVEKDENGVFTKMMVTAVGITV